MSETDIPLISPGESFLSANSLELLAARNATLRLRAPSGHVYSFTDLTSAGGLVNFGHLNPAMDAAIETTADLAAGFYPPAAAPHAAWLCGKLELENYGVTYRAGCEAAVNAAIGMAQAARPGKVLTLEGSGHVLPAWAEQTSAIVRIRPGAEFDGWDEVSCLLYEPIQRKAGYVPLALPWIRGLSQAAQAAGATVIADETETGFYRFGRLSLAASEFLRPDIFLFGNSMTNGIYPLFALVYPKALEARTVEMRAAHALAGAVAPVPRAFEPHASGFQTSALGFAAAEAVARYVDHDELEERLSIVNEQLNQGGERLAANPQLTAFHLAGPTLSLEVRGGRADEFQAACHARGVLVGVGGAGRRVLIAPPITIAADQLRSALMVVEKVAERL